MQAHTTKVLRKRKDFNIDDIKTHVLADRIYVTRKSITDPSTIAVVKEPNRWTKRKSEIRNACSVFTDEEISLHECVASSSWESR
jgi:hypothetical protein